MGKVFGFIMVVLLAMASSEDAQPTQTKNSHRNKRGSSKNRLIKETFSNGNPDKCQIFKVWKINGQRIGCCTDDKSAPLTLCVDNQGNEIENNAKISDYKCPNPWECTRRS